jgi:(E)-4-hydroxy-3-methylbut-2-enyl-diphosphate synthase
VIKTRIAFEKLLAQGIGDTIRVSLTLPNERKHEEVEVGHQIVRDVEADALSRFPISVPV